MNRPNPARVIQTTTAATDRTKAVKETTPEGKKKIYLKGPLSEIFFRALNILYEKDSLYEGNYSMENNPHSQTPQLTASNEGLFDFVKTIFKRKKGEGGEKQTREDVSIERWMRENIVNGNLRQGLVIRGGEITLSGKAASAMLRSGKVITDIEAEIRKDLKELLALYAQHKSLLLNVAKESERFEKDLYGLPNNVTLDQLENTILKYKNSLRPLLVRAFKEPSYVFLGAPTQGFTKKSSFRGKHWAEFTAEPSFKDAPVVRNIPITREKVISLIRLQAELEKHLLTMHYDPGADGWEGTGTGPDVTDFPIRGYYDELNENEAINEILSYFGGENIAKNFTFLATNIVYRLNFMMDLIWAVVRESVVEESKMNVSKENHDGDLAPVQTNEKVYVYTAVASEVNAQDVADVVKLHNAAKQDGGAIRVLLLLGKGEKLESVQEQNAQLDILLRFTQMQSIATDVSLNELIESVH